MAATAVIGLVMDEMRKIVSRRIGSSEPSAIAPTASTWPSPRRAIIVTRPGTSPRST